MTAEPTLEEPARETGFWDLQQRFEESRVGQNVISVVVAVIVVVGVVWNLPDSPIQRSLLPIVEPTVAVNLNRSWAVFAPEPPKRTQEVEVEVAMIDGSKRIWTGTPTPGVTKMLVASRWQRLLAQAVRDPAVRPGIARWVVGHVTRPGEHPTAVTMTFRTQNLAPPGVATGDSAATKVLYREDLTGSW